MSNTLKVKRGTNLSNAGTPAAGELLYKSDTNQLFVGDGSTAATGLSPIGGSASGDIEGVTAGNGLTGGGTTGTVDLNIGAGTGIDVAADAISVDVSDFMSNGADNRILTATGTDAMAAESRLFFDGSHYLDVNSVDDAEGGIRFSKSATDGTHVKYHISHREDNQSLIIYSYDGTTFRNWITLDEPNALLKLGSATANPVTINSSAQIAAASLDISGDVDVDGTMEADAITVNGTTLNEHIQDTVGAMFSSNTETRISATYQDGDGTIDLVVDDMTANDNTVTTNIAGTGIDVSSGTGNSTISVDVSDFMTNGSNNRVLTATGTDGINAESSLTFNGTQLTNTGDIKIASGSLGVNTNAPSGDGRIRATSYITAGYGTGGVALTHNDGYGNANVTFNHEAGVPEQNGQSARIEVNTDATSSEALMSFETSASDVTSGSAQGLTESFKIAHDYIEMPKRLRHMGDTDTYIQYDANRIYLVAGGTTKYDSNNGNVIATGDILDQDDMSSNSATAVASQQSIKAYVDAEVADIVNSAPSALNTLDELAAALGDDANFATTTSTSLGNRLRVDTASQGLTGTQQANAITNLGITATKAELNYVDGVTSAIQTQLNGKLSTSGTAANSTLLNNLGAGSFLRSDADDTWSGNISTTSTNGIRFGSANQTDGNDGYIAAGKFASGLNIVGTQTSSGTGRQIRIYGDLIDSAGTAYQKATTFTANAMLSTRGTTDRDNVGNSAGLTISYSQSTGSNKPTGTDHSLLTMSYSSAWQNQIAQDWRNDGRMYIRGQNNGTWSSWHQVFSDDDVIPSANLDSDTAHLSGTQTFSGAKTFSDSVRITGGTKYLYLDNDDESQAGLWFRDNQDQGGQYAKIFFNSGGSNPLSFFVKSSTAVLQLASSTATVNGNIAVSGTVDGRDVASDGSKLDGIESGATADQSASEILTAIKTVDGGGSGLDADTLDGLQLNSSTRNNQANTVVRTQDNGYALFGWINTTSGNTTNASTDYYVNTNDGYIRKKTLANVRTEIMGVSSGSSFLRSDATDTASGAITFTARTTFDDSGADGVLFKASDNANNSSRAFFDGTSTSCIFQEGNDLSFRINATTGSSSGTERVYIREAGMALRNASLGVNASINGTNGMIHASNDIVAFASDKRLKENISPIENALDKVSKLSGFVYNWNELANEKAEYDMDKDYVGVYAQDVEEVQPEAVDLAPFDNDGEDNSISGENYLTVQYEKLVPLLIESIKELKAEIEELKK
jgi:hypothetical protein